MTWNVADDIPTEYVADYKEMGKPRLIIAPSDLYPAMVAHIQDVISGLRVNEDGQPVIPILPELAIEESDFKGAKSLIQWAYGLPESAWQDALTPRSEFADDDPRLADRAQALDCALGWYTRALRMECIRNNAPVPDRVVTRDLDYRL